MGIVLISQQLLKPLIFSIRLISIRGQWELGSTFSVSDSDAIGKQSRRGFEIKKGQCAKMPPNQQKALDTWAYTKWHACLAQKTKDYALPAQRQKVCLYHFMSLCSRDEAHSVFRQLLIFKGTQETSSRVYYLMKKLTKNSRLGCTAKLFSRFL